MEHYVIALDLGTSTTSIIAGVIDAREPYGLRVLYQETTPSMGIKRGSVYNNGDAQKMITNLIMGAEKKINKKTSAQVKKWYLANISGTNFRSEIKRYDMNMSGQTINEVTLNNLKDEARDKTLISMEEECQRFVPVCYSVDSEPVISDPRGHTAQRLEGYFLSYVASKEAIANINQSMPKSIKLSQTYTSASAKAAMLLSDEDLKSGVVLVDLGAGTTNVAIAVRGAIHYEVSIPFGSNTITNDLAQGIDVTRDQAETIKKYFGLAGESKVNARNVDVVIDGETLNVDVHKVDYFIRARAEEIVGYVDSAIQQSRCRAGVKSIILAGGGAELKGLAELFKEVIGVEVRIAQMPRTSIDATETLSSAMGMASIFARECKSLFVDKKNDQQPDLFNQAPEQPQEQPPVQTKPSDDSKDKANKDNFFKKIMNGVGSLMNDGPDL